MSKLKIICAFLVCILLTGGCTKEQKQQVMQDGSYTAQMSEYSSGWREYVTIIVKNSEIVSVEYNAENPSGFIKSWDNSYMNKMKSITGTYPNEYTRYYAAQLYGQKEMPEIDVLTGASTSASNFQKLSKAVIEQAMNGDSSIVKVNP